MPIIKINKNLEEIANSSGVALNTGSVIADTIVADDGKDADDRKNWLLL